MRMGQGVRTGTGASPVSYRHSFLVFFSSPEHEVLMVSYCDQSLSLVRRVSCVVNNLF